MTIDEWTNLSEQEREKLQEQWNPYGEGYWHQLVKDAAQRFRDEYGSQENVKSVDSGTYHGGTLIIGVSTGLTHPEKANIPDKYLGFPIMQFGYAPDKKET